MIKASKNLIKKADSVAQKMLKDNSETAQISFPNVKKTFRISRSKEGITVLHAIEKEGIVFFIGY